MKVYSPDQNIDPVGSCVGQKGVRIQNVINELNGEKIDVIEWNEDPSIYNYPHASGYKTRFLPGMVVALEPITAQTSESYIEDKINKRNLYTKHGDLGAQREYTVAI